MVSFRSRLFFAAALPLALAACAVYKNENGAERIAYVPGDTSSGIAILSTGAPHSCAMGGSALRLMRRGFDEVFTPPYLPVDDPAVRSDYTDHFGFLYVLRLPPGKYFLISRPLDSSLTSTRSDRFDFSIAAGEIAYLGEFHTDSPCDSLSQGRFTDRWERDAALLATKNPALSHAEVQSRVLQRTWEIKFSP